MSLLNNEKTILKTKEQLQSEEMASTVSNTLDKTIKTNKDIFINQIFDINGILNIIKKYKLERLLFIPFIILIFSHISFGYTITLHRLILLIAFTISFSIIYTLYLILKRNKTFELIFTSEKYQYLRPLITIIFIMLFISIVYIFMKYISKIHLHKYNFKIPSD